MTGKLACKPILISTHDVDQRKVTSSACSAALTRGLDSEWLLPYLLA
jgi:hypothetical protein